MYIKRLLKAIIYSGVAIFIIIHDHGTSSHDIGANVWGEQLEFWADSIPGNWGVLASILVLIYLILPLILLVKGYYYFTSAHIEEGPLDKLDWSGASFSDLNKPSDGDTANIEKVMEYRNSKMYAMDNKMAAEEFKSTAWVDGLFADKSANTTRVRNYVNSELAARTNEQGYQWLKNNR